MNILFKSAISLVFFSQILIPVFSLCTTTCNPNSQVLDLKKCACIPKIDCSVIEDDSVECQSLDCDDDVAASCPNKCLCQRPSAQTGYCLPCLNGGVIDADCDCDCKNGFQGPQCQYQPDPCKAKDDVYCSKVNCWNATNSDFFKCPLKCMCCKNAQCKNLGTLKSDCTCECLFVPKSDADMTNIYDETKQCEIKPDSCVDDRTCALQFFPSKNPENCKNDFVRALCPKSCKVCV